MINFKEILKRLTTVFNVNSKIDAQRICIVQTGRLGDTIIAMPIAKYYADKGFRVDWIIHENYSMVLKKHVDYLENIIVVPKAIDIMDSIPAAYKMLQRIYGRVIDLSIGFPGTKINYAPMMRTDQSFVHTKYKLADVPIDHLWNLTYTRNIGDENTLFEEVTRGAKDYVLVHADTSTPELGELFEVKSEKPIIKFGPHKNYTIFDWRKIIEHASEIHCSDSSLINFVDKLDLDDRIKLVEYKSLRLINPWISVPLRKNWEQGS